MDCKPILEVQATEEVWKVNGQGKTKKRGRDGTTQGTTQATTNEKTRDLSTKPREIIMRMIAQKIKYSMFTI